MSTAHNDLINVTDSRIAVISSSYNPFQNIIPDFLRKKKDTTPVPVSSQRPDQRLPTSTTESSPPAVAATPSSTTDGASEDIFAQVEKLEEDLGLGTKRRKAKEVCRFGPFLFLSRSTFPFQFVSIFSTSPSRSTFPRPVSLPPLSAHMLTLYYTA